MRDFRSSRWLHATLVGVLLASVAGCTVQSAVALKPQSHFTSPNSNVTPIGRVQGEASVSSIFAPPVSDADAEEEAIQMALKEKSGDVLIDYTLSTRTILVPLVFLNIFTTTYHVEGTAAKAEIGRRQLR